MNFIRHLRDWMERFGDDDRLSATHVALYIVLFFEWNQRRFESPFPVLRSEMMGLAKIRSPNAYARCMRELDHWGYIRYSPSYNPRQASMVHLFRFNKRDTEEKSRLSSGEPQAAEHDKNVDVSRASDLYENTALHTGVDIGPATASDTAAIPVAIPFIIKDLNNTNKQILINTHESGDKNSDFSNHGRTPDSPETDRAHTDQKRQVGKRRGGRSTPQDVEEVKTFFAKKKASLTEAEHFYNYFQSIGWKIGKLHKPVEDWRFAAKNWIMNNNKNENDDQPLTLRPGASQVRLNKNYDQPL